MTGRSDDEPRRTARGKIVGSHRVLNSEFYVSRHYSRWGVFMPSGALERLHNSEADAYAEAWRLTAEWKRR